MSGCDVCGGSDPERASSSGPCSCDEVKSSQNMCSVCFTVFDNEGRILFVNHF
jgi:hypothetical protein